jgi:hypothetical protein
MVANHIIPDYIFGKPSRKIIQESSFLPRRLELKPYNWVAILKAENQFNRSCVVDIVPIARVQPAYSPPTGVLLCVFTAYRPLHTVN